MRNLKSIALIAALTLTNISYAASSTPIDYDTAVVSGQSTDVGTFKETVNFTVSSGAVDLEEMKASTTYVITIPVENTTDRDIALSLKNVRATSGATSIESITASTETTALPLAAGAPGELTITVVTKAADKVVPGEKLTISYDVEGVATSY